MTYLDVIVRLAVLLVVALHLLAEYFPEQAAWSIWPYTAVPRWLAWLAALAVVSLALQPVNDGVRAGLARLWNALPGKEHHRRWYLVCALAAAIPFWLLRIQHLAWGDANFIVQALSYTGADRPVWTIYNWQSPLTILAHAQLWFLLNPLTGIGVDTLYALTSVLSGVGFVYTLLLMADALGRDHLEKVFIFGLVATTGSVQLFFGYVENYTIMSLGLMVTLYLGVRCLQGKVRLLWPALALAITNAFHPSSLVLWPAMLFLAGRLARAGRTGGARGQALIWGQLVLPPLLVFAGLAALMTAAGHGPAALLTDDRPGGADGVMLVPLFQISTPWQRYTMFSLAHLQDWANEHFLISPFGLFLLLLAACLPHSRRRSANPPEARSLEAAQETTSQARGVSLFLLIASLSYLILTFIWNPDYGGRQDWDLFAPSAFVYSLLAAYEFSRRVTERYPPAQARPILARAALILLAGATLHSGAWIYYNTIPR